MSVSSFYFLCVVAFVGACACVGLFAGIINGKIRQVVGWATVFGLVCIVMTNAAFAQTFNPPASEIKARELQARVEYLERALKTEREYWRDVNLELIERCPKNEPPSGGNSGR